VRDVDQLKGLLRRAGRKPVSIERMNAHDPAQARKANALMDGAVTRGERLHLDVVVLCELVWVLRGAYGFRKPEVVDAMAKILDAARFAVEDRDLLREALAAYRDRQGDFADHVLGLRNREAGCSTTATFDRALKGSASFAML
jgi:predicted nucleic-acid-binding protein